MLFAEFDKLMDSFGKLVKTFSRYVANLEDIFIADAGITKQTAAAFDICAFKIDFGNDADGGQVEGLDKIGPDGILTVNSGIDHNDKAHVQRDVDDFGMPKRHLDEFAGGVHKIIGVNDLLCLFVFEFFAHQALAQTGFARADAPHHGDAVSVACHNLGVGDVSGNIKTEGKLKESDNFPDGRVDVGDPAGDDQ